MRSGGDGGRVCDVKTETLLWRCIYDHANRQRGRLQREVKAADMSRATEGRVSEALLNKWRYTPTLPSADLLAAIQNGLGVPYMDMLEAALTDRGWLPSPARDSATDRLADFFRETRVSPEDENPETPGVSA
jgi:hypothetical protein